MESIKGLVISYGEGSYKMGKSRVRDFLRPPQDRVIHFAPLPPFKEWKLFESPASIWLNFKLLRKNYSKTFCAPPSAWLKLFLPPFYVGVRLHMPPLPVLSDQSLKMLTFSSLSTKSCSASLQNSDANLQQNR